VSRRSRELIQLVAAADPLMAAACMAETEGVSVTVAEAVIARLSDLAADRAHAAGALKAAALMASNTKMAWSRQAFDVIRTARVSAAAVIRDSAISALANVPTKAAAMELVGALQGAGTRDVAERALKQIGAPALPALQMVLQSNADPQTRLACLALCGYVSSPEVIDVLVPVLLHSSDAVGERSVAAQSLATLIRDSSIEEGLRLTTIADARLPAGRVAGLTGRGERRAWPFREDEHVMLPLVAQAIVDELTPCVERLSEAGILDSRIGVPLFLQTIEQRTDIPRDVCFSNIFGVPLVAESQTMRTVLAHDFYGPELHSTSVDLLWTQWQEIEQALEDLRTGGRTRQRNAWLSLLAVQRAIRLDTPPWGGGKYRAADSIFAMDPSPKQAFVDWTATPPRPKRK
jgi:hypothetical protein